jgi:phage gpG-like protein
MPARITIEINGQKQFDRVFQRFDEDLKDLTPIGDDMRDAFWDIEKEQFQSEGTKGASGRWAPLSPAYEKRKIAAYGTFAVIAGILIATEEMYKSLTRDTPNTVYQKDHQGIVIGTSLARARYHQEATSRMPARPPISFSDQQKRYFMKEVQKSLVRELRKGGIYVDYSGDVGAPFGTDTSI